MKNIKHARGPDTSQEKTPEDRLALSSSVSPRWRGYGVVVLSLSCAILFRWLLDPELGDNLQLLTLYGAVAVSVWFGGWRPGLVATLVGFLTADYFFIPPRFEIVLNSASLATFAGYSISCGIIIYFGERMRRANARLKREAIEREAIEQGLAREKELLATTLASIGDAVIVTDAYGCIVSLNTEAERLTGWPESEAVGHQLPQVFHAVNELNRQPVENPVEKVLRLGTVAGLANHTILLSRDGREVPIDDSAAPIRQPGGPLLGVVLVFRDVTVHREAQQARARLSAIIEFSGDAIATKNLDGIIQTWNAAAERLFGYRAEEIIGKPVTILIPADRMAEEEQILSRLRRGLPAERIETLRVTKDGRQIPVSVSVSPIQDPEGRVIGASTVIHDISERKRIEMELFHYREELERRVAERTAELRQSVRTLEELLYTIAHDLRAPNRAMQGYSHLLESEYSSKLDETATDYLHRISAAALRNDALITDLLEFGRLAQQDVPVTRIDPRQVAEVTVGEFEGEARRRRATIRIGHNRWPTVWANAAILRQILGNLLSNALKYGTSDGRPCIELDGTLQNGHAMLSVKDNGAGIPSESQASIFEPFTRLGNTVPAQGTGMGLAIVRKAAERMQGKVGVDSRPGKGACFWVQLPLALSGNPPE